MPGGSWFEFDESTLLRREWNATDITSKPEDNPFADRQQLDLNRVEKALGTMSQVTRWREVHVEAVSTDS